MAKMTKAKFFKIREAQRAAGMQYEYIEPERKFELTDNEEARALEALGSQKSGVYRTADVRLQGLKTVEVYEGAQIKVQRKRVDELDNVTISKK